MVHCLAAMGQNSSLPKGRKRSLRSSSKSFFSKSLSHTFTLHENDSVVELLNINTASEEALMTLDGVNREVAKNIVEHRKAIGRFRKVEDLALVKGIGADKLQHLRPEICVSSKKLNSRTSSRAPSYDSLRSTDSRLTLKFNGYINVNKATVFDLQTLNGVNQEIAASIVQYRGKKGRFKKIEDLLKVKGIDNVLLNNISMYLTVDDIENITEIDEDPKPPILTNGFTMPYYNKSMQRKLPVMNGLSISSEADIFELLSTYSPRPIVQLFNFENGGDPAIRIGSWNLNEFSYDKACNLGVKEVICRTILENGLSILAVQDIQNVTALRAICEELNNPRLQRIREWKDKQHYWNFCMLDVHNSRLGFIYDSDGPFDIELIALNEGPIETRTDCKVLIATFRIDNINLQLVNMTLNSLRTDSLNKKLTELIGEEDKLMIFIDFSHVKETYLPLGNLKMIFSLNTKTTFTESALNKNFPNASNILYNSKLEKQLTGTHCVVRQGLTHLAIPNGWSWGGPASPYCPIWAELYINSIDSSAL